MPEIIHHRSSIIHRRGIALLAVLFIIMAITVLSLGFLARSSTELACGQNTALHVQMDQLAASGLEHARGLILDPQEVTSEYWTGATGQQLASSTNDFYDVTVAADPNDHCNYTITSNAYRMNGQERIGQSALAAELRLDPAIALWTGAATTLTSGLTVNGDVSCGGNLVSYGTIDGDVFANALTGTGTRTGHLSTLAQLSLGWPAVTPSRFTSYDHTHLSSTLPSGTYGPYDPTHVLYRYGNLAIDNGAAIHAMLLVEGNLTIRGNGNTLTAPKNVPALYVTGDLVIGDVANLDIEGLVVVGGRLLLGAGAANVNVRGALFIGNRIIETTADSSSNGIYGCVYGTPVWHPTGGRIGGALQFDGVDDYVQTPDSSTAVELFNDYTLSVWINADPVQMASATILRKCSSDEATSCWTLQFDNSGQEIVVWHNPWFGSPQSWSTGIRATKVTGGWHHVCVTRNGSSMKSYLDGDPCGVGNLSAGFQWVTGHLNIGTKQAASSQYRYKGFLDGVRVYSVTLNSDDVEKLAGKRAGAPGHSSDLLGYWAFDESGAQVVVSADPVKAALVTWPGGVPTNWSPAAGAFFKQVSRVTP